MKKFILVLGLVLMATLASAANVIGDWTILTKNAFSLGGRQWGAGTVYDGKMWQIGGFASGIIVNDVYYSTDGIDWTLATGNAAFGPRENSKVLTYNNKMWLIGGDTTGQVKQADVWYSTDGVDWTMATGNAAFGARTTHGAVVYDNKMWVFGGSTTAVYTNDVWYSTNGADWSLATGNANWTGRRNMGVNVYDNKMWIVSGEGTGSPKDVWYSTDGIDWTATTKNAEFGNNSQYPLWACNGYMFMGAGTPKIYRSEDGISWVQDNKTNMSVIYAGCTGLTYNNKMYVLGSSLPGYTNDVDESGSVATRTATQTVTQTNTPTPTVTKTATSTVTPTSTPTPVGAGSGRFELAPAIGLSNKEHSYISMTLSATDRTFTNGWVQINIPSGFPTPSLRSTSASYVSITVSNAVLDTSTLTVNANSIKFKLTSMALNGAVYLNYGYPNNLVLPNRSGTYYFYVFTRSDGPITLIPSEQVTTSSNNRIVIAQATRTITPTYTAINTKTVTPTITLTKTPVNTETITPTISETATKTVTKTATPTKTITGTITPTSTKTVTKTVTATVTGTITKTTTETVTPTNTKTNTNTVTPTSTKTNTATVTPTNTPISTSTPNPSRVRTITSGQVVFTGEGYLKEVDILYRAGDGALYFSNAASLDTATSVYFYISPTAIGPATSYVTFGGSGIFFDTGCVAYTNVTYASATNNTQNAYMNYQQ